MRFKSADSRRDFSAAIPADASIRKSNVIDVDACAIQNSTMERRSTAYRLTGSSPNHKSRGGILMNGKNVITKRGRTKEARKNNLAF